MARRKASRKARRAQTVVHPDAAGIDIGSDRHWVAVPADRDEQPVRSFRSFTRDLRALVAWLRECEIRTVAMESTGVYWIPLYELLEAEGFEVFLVDARHVHNVPGRKSDVLDCQWIQQLHSFGLLRASFRPEGEIIPLRGYARQRERLVQSASRQIQHMQKALSQMNVQLHNVISDLTGKTGIQILRAIVAGQRDPAYLAQFRDPRCKASEAEIAASLEGSYREEHLFALEQALELYDVFQDKLRACDARMEQVLKRIAPECDRALPAARKRAKPRGNEPLFEIRDPLFRLLGGVDLTQIEGLAPYSVLRIVSEIGTDITRWPSVKHFCAWLRIAPGTKISGGKRLDRATLRGSPRAATLLRQAACTVGRTQTALGAFYRRIAARAGAGKAVVATAHKLARILYTLLKTGEPYQATTLAVYDRQQHQRLTRSLVHRAKALGYRLVPAAPDPVPVLEPAVS